MLPSELNTWLDDMWAEVSGGRTAVHRDELGQATCDFVASVEAELRAMGGAMPADVPVTWNWR